MEKKKLINGKLQYISSLCTGCQKVTVPRKGMLCSSCRNLDSIKLASILKGNRAILQIKRENISLAVRKIEEGIKIIKTELNL